MRKLVPSLGVLVLLASGGGTTVRAEVLPQAINVGEQVTGTFFGPTTCSATGCIPGVFEMLFELTAPSDGTLVVELVGESGEAIGLELENGVVHHWPIKVGILPVTAGRTYRIWVYSNIWDLFGELPFVLTTSITSGPLDLPPFCSQGPPGPGWICYGEGWAPPGHSLAEGVGAGPAPPPPPPPPPAGCTTPDPFAGIPGLIGVCIGNNNWVPLEQPLSGGTIPAPQPPPPPPPPPPPTGCTTPDPFAGIPGLIGVCIGNNNWVPFDHPLARGGGG